MPCLVSITRNLFGFEEYLSTTAPEYGAVVVFGPPEQFRFAISRTAKYPSKKIFFIEMNVDLFSYYLDS